MVSFKNESVKQRIEKRRKSQSSSFGVIIAFLILIVVAGVFGVMKFWQSALDEEIAGYDEQINGKDGNGGIKGEMQSLMSGEEADFYKRMDLVKKNIYKKHSSVSILNEIENIVVPRVVLLSLTHSVDNRGLEQVVITADADEFYLMAQQIEEFKKSKFFGNVRASDTSKDNAGRIVFTITANVVDSDYTLYSENNQGMVQQNYQGDAQADEKTQPQVPVEIQEGDENVEGEIQEENQVEDEEQKAVDEGN